MPSPIEPLFSASRRAAIENRANRIHLEGSDFLFEEASQNIFERLEITQRQFEQAIDLFSPKSHLSARLKGLTNVSSVVRVSRPGTRAPSSVPPDLTCAENNLPFSQGSLNLVTSIFGLHWCNDLKSVLRNILEILHPDGLLLAALPGSETLKELRASLLEAELEHTGSASLRVEPFGEVRQFGNLLRDAGFTLPVADSDLHVARYDSLFDLVNDLRAMGFTSSLVERASTPRTLFSTADRIYREKHADADGRIRATFELIYLTGWKPHPSQQKPLRPGSASNRLSDFLEN